MHKKCPFCGGEPQYQTREEEFAFLETFTYGYIRCSSCYCSTSGVCIYHSEDDDCYATEEDAWKQWDRRSE